MPTPANGFVVGARKVAAGGAVRGLHGCRLVALDEWGRLVGDVVPGRDVARLHQHLNTKDTARTNRSVTRAR